MEPLRKYSREEVRNHDRSETWIIIDNKVYDCTRFLNEHPGGEDLILEQAGEDATEAFIEASHSSEAREMLSSYLIGEIIDSEKIERKVSIPKETVPVDGLRATIIVCATITIGVFLAYRYFRSSSN